MALKEWKSTQSKVSVTASNPAIATWAAGDPMEALAIATIGWLQAAIKAASLATTQVLLALVCP